ncbi:MAG: hypothetical protein OEW24_03715 [Chloroflexota bacterium]|nr:hypothetical protein [Chloroflexota bacterium]
MDKHSDRARILRTLTGTATTALAALFMVGAITFGASVLRPMSANPDADATTAQVGEESAGNGGSDASEAPSGETDKPDADADADGFVGDEEKDLPDWQPSDKTDAPEPTEKPAVPKATDKPQPTDKPAPSGAIHLEAFVNADSHKIVVKWTAYAGDFEKYKLMRSRDATVTWPGGEDDELVAVIGPDDMTKFYDSGAPCGKEFHYRVFAVSHGENGYVVKAASNVGGAFNECSAPPAEPKALGFEVFQTADGIKLAWEACGADGFAAYKVVRSATNANPLYPLNDGTELIGVVGDPGSTYFVDTAVEPGQTFTYRVLSMGSGPDGWYVLGLTAAVTITVE